MKEELYINSVGKTVWEKQPDGFDFLHNMSQYETIDIDYSNCHPVVEYFLRRGKMVKCARMGFVNYPHEYDPIKKKKRKVLGKKALIQRLLGEGYLPDSGGDWTNSGSKPFIFTSRMFEFCGKEPEDMYDWSDRWLEDE